MAIEQVDERKLVIVVTGSRYWSTDEHIMIIARELSKFPKDTILVHGDQRGVDRIAKSIGEYLGFEVRDHPADWDRFGRAAGAIRNVEMLKEKPILVIGFHDRIDESSGTKHMLSIACKANVKSTLFMC